MCRPTVCTKVNLYKLLLYPAGGHFATHRDTEKEPGMFGTLIVQLPAGHKGGALAVRHNGEEIVWETERDSNTQIHYCAFYADCEHELKPVTSGWRLVLVYNLVRKHAQIISQNTGHTAWRFGPSWAQLSL